MQSRVSLPRSGLPGAIWLAPETGAEMLAIIADHVTGAVPELEPILI